MGGKGRGEARKGLENKNFASPHLLTILWCKSTHAGRTDDLGLKNNQKMMKLPKTLVVLTVLGTAFSLRADNDLALEECPANVSLPSFPTSNFNSALLSGTSTSAQ
jgi:hypothetical protein